MNSGAGVVEKLQREAKKKKWVALLRQHLRAYGIAAPALREEFRFHPERLFRFDFALPHIKLGVEVEGGIFSPADGDPFTVIGGALASARRAGIRRAWAISATVRSTTWLSSQGGPFFASPAT
jgi:hypothetical protein